MSEPSLLLGARDLERLLDERELLEALRRAMIATSESGPRAQRAHGSIPAAAAHSVMLVFPGLVPGIPAYTVKINTKRPDGTPSVRGLIALFDLESGALLAVMDSIVITRLRTALVGALAAQALARDPIATVAVLGAGVQGRAQLRALRLVRAFRTVRVYDARPERAAALVADCRDLDAQLSVAATPRDAVRNADLVITATWATAPIVFKDMIAPGTHITAVGADEPGKAELGTDLLRDARVVVDDVDLAVEMGVLAGAGLGRAAAHATLGAVLAGRSRGRTGPDDVTVFGSVGLPCQDLPAAWMAYRRADRARAITFPFHAV